MPAKAKYLCLIGVFIIATFFRFYHLTSTPPGLYMDEAMDGVNAQNVAETGQFKVYYPEDNGREGLYVNILALAFRWHILPNNQPWSVRFPAAVAGTLTVLGVYLLVSELFKKDNEPQATGDEKNGGPKPSSQLATRYSFALLSAFFLATSFWHVNFSRIGFRAILAPFCLVWASWFLFKAFRARRTGTAVWLTIIGSVIFAAGFYTYIAYRVMPLILLFFIPFFRKHPGFWKRVVVFIVAAIIISAPIGWYYLKHPADFFGRTSQISVTSSGSPIAAIAENTLKTALMFNWRGDGNWRHNLAGAPELFWPVGILFLIGFVIAIRKSVKRKASEDPNLPDSSSDSRLPYLFLLAWFVLGALPEILSNDGIPHALRSLLMVVPAVALAALGGVWIYNLLARKLTRRWTVMLIILFLAVVLGGGYQEYFKAWAQNPNVPGSFNADYVAIGERINALPSSTPKYVVLYAGGVIDYGLPMPVEPVLYVTHSFVPDAVAQKFVNNIHYLSPNETSQIPPGTPSDTIFAIR